MTDEQFATLLAAVQSGFDAIEQQMIRTNENLEMIKDALDSGNATD